MKIQIPSPPGGGGDDGTERGRIASRLRSARHRAQIRLKADVEGALVEALIATSTRRGERGQLAGTFALEAVIEAAHARLVAAGYKRKAAAALLQARLNPTAPRVEPLVPGEPCRRADDGLH